MKRILLSLLLLSSSLSAQQKTEDAQLVKQLLNEDLGTRTFQFSQVIESTSGKRVIPFDPSNRNHAHSLDTIRQALQRVIESLNAEDSPAKGLRRINECSRHAEDLLLHELRKQGDFLCEIPSNTNGKKQRSGYPDLRLVHRASGLVLYLDPKLYESKSRASSFRSFYFEPRSRTLKVQDDAVHLLIGIPHDGNSGQWKFAQPEILDLSKLSVRLKAEFQASNRTLYRKALILPAETSEP